MPILDNTQKITPSRTSEEEYFNYKGEYPKGIIFNSKAQAASDPRYSGSNVTPSGSLRCTGGAIDACKYDWRAAINKVGYTREELIGDDSNSVDAWNIKQAGLDSGAGYLYYDKERDGRLTPEMEANIPLNSLVGYGEARGQFISRKNPERKSRHTRSVIGYMPDGKPLYKNLSTFTTSTGNPNYIMAPSDYKWNFNSVMDAKMSADKAPPLNLDMDKYLSQVKHAPQFENNLKEFNQSIMDNRSDIIKSTGLSSDGFNRLHKMAIAIATQESGGARQLVEDTIDVIGDSKGLSQIKKSNLDTMDERYPVATNKFIHPVLGTRKSVTRPDVSGVYTMLMLADNAKGLDEAKNVTSGSGEITEVNPKVAPAVSGVAMMLGINPELASKIGKFSKKLAPKIGRHNLPESAYVTRPTKGNNPNMTDQEIMAYQWNNPARIRTGDAQGKETNQYVGNILKYFNLLE